MREECDLVPLDFLEGKTVGIELKEKVGSVENVVLMDTAGEFTECSQLYFTTLRGRRAALQRWFLLLFPSVNYNRIQIVRYISILHKGA